MCSVYKVDVLKNLIKIKVLNPILALVILHMLIHNIRPNIIAQEHLLAQSAGKCHGMMKGFVSSMHFESLFIVFVAN